MTDESPIPGMTGAKAAALRASFRPEQVEHLPRVWCKACKDAREKHCDRHQIIKCEKCGTGRITSAHIDLSYVGHGETTDRLLEVDPAWTWEPLAVDQMGLPALDRDGGLWIKLTVCGVTRLGYGDAEGKTGPSATKEKIGDAIRNAAMRFGVGIELWGASAHVEAAAERAEHEDGGPAASASAPTRPATPAAQNGNGNGNGQQRAAKGPEQATKAAGALLDAPDAAKLESLAGLVEERGISQDDATTALTPADRKALGIDPEDKVTVDDLIGYLRTFHEQRKAGPRSETAASQSREPAPLGG